MIAGRDCYGGTFRLPRLIRSDHDQTGATFARPDFAAHLSSRYKVLRTMDLGRTNNNAYIIGSATRPLLNDGRGMPLEDQIDLCNQIGADLYYCVPMNASTAYIDAALTLIRDRLTASLKVYLEFDNEPWNSAFLQYTGTWRPRAPPSRARSTGRMAWPRSSAWRGPAQPSR